MGMIKKIFGFKVRKSTKLKMEAKTPKRVNSTGDTKYCTCKGRGTRMSVSITYRAWGLERRHRGGSRLAWPLSMQRFIPSFFFY